MDISHLITLAVDGILDEIGLSEITDKQKKEFAKMFNEGIQTRLGVLALSYLTDEEALEAEKMSDVELFKYLEETKDVDLSYLTLIAAQDIKAQFAEDVAFAKGMLAAEQFKQDEN